VMPTIDQPSARAMLLRTVSAESLMLVGVIGLAALLAATPPARMAMGRLGPDKIVAESKTFDFPETFERFRTSHGKVDKSVLRIAPRRPLRGRVSGCLMINARDTRVGR